MQFLKVQTSSIRRIASRTFWLGLLVLVLALHSHATTIILTMDSNWNDYHEYTYTDADGDLVTLPSGPYPVTISGGSFDSGVVLYVMCYDINLDAYAGASYNGIFVLPSDTGEIEAAYLQAKLVELGGYDADVQTVSGPISMAIWQLTDPSSINPAPFRLDPAAEAYVAEAEAAYLNGTWTALDAEQFPLWSPFTPGATQRFGFLEGQAPLPSDVVPEPASLSLVLMAAGLGLVFAVRQRRYALARQRARHS
jgi:hypothetical protein